MIPTSSSSSSCELQPEWFELPGGEALPIPLVSMGGRGERNVAMSTPLPPPIHNFVGLLSLCACVGFATCVCLTPAVERGDRGEEGEIATLVAEVATKKASVAVDGEFLS